MVYDVGFLFWSHVTPSTPNWRWFILPSRFLKACACHYQASMGNVHITVLLFSLWCQPAVGVVSWVVAQGFVINDMLRLLRSMTWSSLKCQSDCASARLSGGCRRLGSSNIPNSNFPTPFFKLMLVLHYDHPWPSPHRQTSPLQMLSSVSNFKLSVFQLWFFPSLIQT